MPIRDFQKHNEEVKRVWESYSSGCPIRVPMIIGMSQRIWLLDPQLNASGISFEQYSTDPNVMMLVQIEFQRYHRFHIIQDAPMGMPDGWDVSVDFQNYYEAAWWGAEVYYRSGQVPDTHPFLNLDNRNLLFDRGIPEPVSGIFARGIEYFQYMQEQIGREYYGIPINKVGPPSLCTEGPLTACLALFNPSEFLILMKTEPEWAKEFLNFILEGTIRRINGIRRLLGWDTVTLSGILYDDAVELISPEDYIEFILPLHRRYLKEVFGVGLHKIHMCGDAQRHFSTIVRELPIRQIDTGFPIDWRTLRDDVGEDVEIMGGVEVPLLKDGTPQKIQFRTKEILKSGIRRGGKFIFREANSLAPGTPPANVRAMYNAVKTFGHYW